MICPAPRSIRHSGLLLTLCAALAACGGSDSQTPTRAPAAAPPPPPTAATEPAPTATAPTTVAAAEPVAAAPAAAPDAAPSGDAARGAAPYATYCASCHGVKGDGDGPLAAALDPKPTRHSDGAYMNALDDAHLYKAIAEGGAAVGKSPTMAPWAGTLDEQQIRDVVAFVRSLAVPPYSR